MDPGLVWKPGLVWFGLGVERRRVSGRKGSRTSKSGAAGFDGHEGSGRRTDGRTFTTLHLGTVFVAVTGIETCSSDGDGSNMGSKDGRIEGSQSRQARDGLRGMTIR